MRFIELPLNMRIITRVDEEFCACACSLINLLSAVDVFNTRQKQSALECGMGRNEE